MRNQPYFLWLQLLPVRGQPGWLSCVTIGHFLGITFLDLCPDGAVLFVLGRVAV